MKPKPICKHCGRWLQEHQTPPSNPEDIDTIKDGYVLSLFECLVGDGFEPKEQDGST